MPAKFELVDRFTAKLEDCFTTKLEDRFKAKLVNRLTATKLVGRSTAKFVSRLTAKQVNAKPQSYRLEKKKCFPSRGRNIKQLLDDAEYDHEELCRSRRQLTETGGGRK